MQLVRIWTVETQLFSKHRAHNGVKGGQKVGCSSVSYSQQLVSHISEVALDA